jgi:hypothetical protein
VSVQLAGENLNFELLVTLLCRRLLAGMSWRVDLGRAAVEGLDE